MAKLQYTFKNDLLFKMLFVKYPDLLKKLISELISIEYKSIEQFIITNPEIPPERIGDKFCRLDINMTVNGQRVDLEIQVNDEGDYTERSLFYWAREFSTAIGSGDDYTSLPRTIIVSILGFNLFTCEEYHSEYQALEVTRHTLLSDKMSLHYFELPKLPKLRNVENTKELWLNLFNAKTEEELIIIKSLGVPAMEQAIKAYHEITAESMFRESERLRIKASYDEASALNYAEKRGERLGAKRANAKWRGVVAEKDAALSEKDAALSEKDAALSEKDAALSEKDAVLSEKDAIIAQLRKQIDNPS